MNLDEQKGRRYQCIREQKLKQKCINQITALIKKWNVVDQGNEILKDFHGYR